MQNEIFIATVLKNSVGLLLVVACIGKAKGFKLFQTNLSDSFHVPATLVLPLASFIILAEFGLAGLLLLGTTKLVLFSLYASFVLFLVFSMVVAQKLVTYQKVACNCFGATKENITPLDLIRNGLILLCCLAAYYYYESSTFSRWDIGAIGFMSIILAIVLLNFKGMVNTTFFKGY
jgi:hypothetical protein